MRTATIILAVLAVTQSHQARGSEAEFQITPRLGFGEIALDADALGLNTTTKNGVDTLDAGVSLGYLTPFGLVLEAGLQGQTNVSIFGGDSLRFAERYVAAGFQLEFGPGLRFTPKVGRTRWQLRNKEGQFLNPGPEAREELNGYEDFWEVSLTKTISDYVAMGLRYKSTDYDFGRVTSGMFVTTFGFR